MATGSSIIHQEMSKKNSKGQMFGFCCGQRFQRSQNDGSRYRDIKPGETLEFLQP